MKHKDLKALDFPQRIVIELTPQCNLSCSMCPGRYDQQIKGNMSLGLWKKLINEITDLSPASVVLPFWRGESLLHPDFTEIMEYSFSKSIKSHISTNGHTVTKKQFDLLARCDFVTFSIHTIAGYSNAEHILSLKKYGKPVVQLSFVKGEKTTNKFFDFLAAEPNLKGFNSIRLYEKHTTGGVFGKSSALLKGSKRRFCKKLTDTLVIAYNGTVSRCNHIWETKNEINLNKISIAEAWSSKFFKEIRGNYPDEKCEKCDQWIGHTLGESWRIVNGKKEHIVFTA